MKNQSSSSIYSSFVLKLYDFWVLKISNTYAWECPTGSKLLPFFRRFVSYNHLDVGVGTGFYPSHLKPGSGCMTLLDANQHCLDATAVRCRHLSVSQLCHDILQPLPIKDKFDSISVFFLIHCLNGTINEKQKIFSNLKNNLSGSGVLYGATIVGESANHNRFGRLLMRAYNRKGIFGNQHDTAEDLQRMLKLHFSNVSIEICGKVALFSATSPI